MLSVIALGWVALLMMGIEPLVLGALQAAGRLSRHGSGRHRRDLGAVSAIMAARVRHRHLRLWGLAGVLLLVAANGAGGLASGPGFVRS